MLPLVPGAVADADGACAVVAGQMIERLLGQFPLAGDPVHDLQVRVLLGEVGEEVEEVVGFPVQAQRVQAPEHERRIPQPGIAVVVVALSARRLRQRRRRRRQQGAGRRVDEPLQRQRRPLQVLAPRVVGEVAPAEPLVPEIRGPRQPLVSVAEGLRRGPIPPRQRAENPLSRPQAAPRNRPRALKPYVQVGGQPQQRARLAPADLGLPVAASGVPPGAPLAAVIKRRLTFQHEVNGPLQAPDRPQQYPLSAMVHRHPPVSPGSGRVVTPRPYQQHIAGHRPARRGPPRRLQHHRPGQIAPSRRDHDIRRPEPEPAGPPVQHRGEDARAVHPGQAHPLDIAVRRHQRRHLAIRQEAIISNRRKRAPVQCRPSRMRSLDELVGHRPSRSSPSTPRPSCQRGQREPRHLRRASISAGATPNASCADARSAPESHSPPTT